MMKMTFEKFNESANYYSARTRATGKNVWDQNAFQREFQELIAGCNLTSQQLDDLASIMVENNAVLDMEPSKNSSYQEFNAAIVSKKDTLQHTLSSTKNLS